MTTRTETGGAQHGIGRRAILQGAAVAGAAMCAPPALATQSRILDPGDPSDARIIYRKMRYRSDSGLIFVWIQGPQLAIIGAELTPLYALNFGAIQRIISRPDGGFELREIDFSFAADSDTGKRLTRFRNPITGKTVEVPSRRPRPVRVSYTSENALIPPNQIEGAKFTTVHSAPVTFSVGDDFFLRDTTRSQLAAPGTRPRSLNEISIFSAPRRAVLDPAVTCVNVNLQSNDVIAWPDWLNMADIPGSLGLYAVGRKVARFADFPPDLLAMISEAYPNIATDPIGALDATTSG